MAEAVYKGTWFDSFNYDSDLDPDKVVNTDDCNGRLYSNDELKLIISELEQVQDDMHISEETRIFLSEILFKAQCGIDCNPE